MRAAVPALAAAILAAAAQAAAPGPGARIARVSPGDATSNCIGSAESAVCAAETLLACFARADPALCRRVGVGDARGMAREAGPMDYAIERVSVIDAANVTEDLRELEWFKPGYTLIELFRRVCRGLGECSAEPWEALQIYLRPLADGWEVVTWRSESEPDSPAEIPDAFRGAKPP